MVIRLANHWLTVKDGDPRAVALYRHHYSCRDTKVDYCRYGFSGKGESMVLINQSCDSLFCWRLVRGEGVNCSVFHHEGQERASSLILEAEELAWARWPGQRLYTYVNARKIKSSNPGWCFQAAGWRKCGLTKGELVILEKLPS